MFLRDMKTTKRNMNERRGLNTMLAKAMLLVMLFLAGGGRPCGTLSCAPLVLRRFAEALQRMVSEACVVIS